MTRGFAAALTCLALCRVAVGRGLQDASVLLQVVSPETTDSLIFKQKVSAFEPGAGVALHLDRGSCNSTDAFGDRECSVAQGDTVRVTLSYNLKRPIEAGSIGFYTNSKLLGEVVGSESGKLSDTDLMTELSVECAICGARCSVYLFGEATEIAMPACPIPSGQNVTLLDTVVELPRSSFLTLAKMSVDNTLMLKRTLDDGEAFIVMVEGSLRFDRL